VPYGTALLRWRCPRHFVPGYDRTVPPGLGNVKQGEQLNEASVAIALANIKRIDNEHD
jgi:hypothetical protein